MTSEQAPRGDIAPDREQGATGEAGGEQTGWRVDPDELSTKPSQIEVTSRVQPFGQHDVDPGILIDQSNQVCPVRSTQPTDDEVTCPGRRHGASRYRF